MRTLFLCLVLSACATPEDDLDSLAQAGCTQDGECTFNDGPRRWHDPPPTEPDMPENTPHLENFSYTNGCFGACGADCARCSGPLSDGTMVCETSSACKWHDDCYFRCNGDFWCSRGCDIGCVQQYGVADCIGGLFGAGETVVCYDPSQPNFVNQTTCRVDQWGNVIDPADWPDTSNWPYPFGCPFGSVYNPSTGMCDYTVNRGCIGAECVGAGGAWQDWACGEISALVGFNYCAFYY